MGIRKYIYACNLLYPISQIAPDIAHEQQVELHPQWCRMAKQLAIANGRILSGIEEVIRNGYGRGIFEDFLVTHQKANGGRQIHT